MLTQLNQHTVNKCERLLSVPPLVSTAGKVIETVEILTDELYI